MVVALMKTFPGHVGVGDLARVLFAVLLLAAETASSLQPFCLSSGRDEAPSPPGPVHAGATFSCSLSRAGQSVVHPVWHWGLRVEWADIILTVIIYYY